MRVYLWPWYACVHVTLVCVCPCDLGMRAYLWPWCACVLVTLVLVTLVCVCTCDLSMRVYLWPQYACVLVTSVCVCTCDLSMRVYLWPWCACDLGVYVHADASFCTERDAVDLFALTNIWIQNTLFYSHLLSQLWSQLFFQFPGVYNYSCNCGSFVGCFLPPFAHLLLGEPCGSHWCVVNFVHRFVSLWGELQLKSSVQGVLPGISLGSEEFSWKPIRNHRTLRLWLLRCFRVISSSKEVRRSGQILLVCLVFPVSGGMGVCQEWSWNWQKWLVINWSKTTFWMFFQLLPCVARVSAQRSSHHEVTSDCGWELFSFPVPSFSEQNVQKTKRVLCRKKYLALSSPIIQHGLQKCWQFLVEQNTEDEYTGFCFKFSLESEKYFMGKAKCYDSQNISGLA